MVVADSLTRQLERLGIHKRVKPLPTIDELLRVQEHPNGNGTDPAGPAA